MYNYVYNKEYNTQFINTNITKYIVKNIKLE